jgi:uncharacterized membrane protein
MQADAPPTQLPAVRTISAMQPLVWLGLGWRDLAQAGWVSVLHGLAMAIAGALIVAIAAQRFWLLAGALSGFMVVAPVLATGLYAISRALERSKAVDMGIIPRTWLNWQNSHVNKWTPDYWRMMRFGMFLAIAATGWVATSAALITLLAPAPVHTPMDFVQHVMLARDGYLFELWLALGGMMAAPMFASSVVTMPLLLDRRIGLLQAILVSWQTVLANPLPMALWAALILVLTLLGLGSLFLGLIPVIPVLGHASWHAYRDLVDTASLTERGDA